MYKRQISDAFIRLDTLNEQGDINARNALQKNGITFNKPSGTELRTIVKTAMDNLKTKKVYPEDTYQQLLKALQEYRSSTQALAN